MCHIMDKLQPKTGNPLAICFSLPLFLLISCLPNFSKYSYHDTGSDQLYEKNKGGLMIFVWENVVSPYGAATA